VQLFKRGAGLLQLQQVSSTGKSIQVPMKHKQEPPPTIRLQAMQTSSGVPQRERHRGTIQPPDHAGPSAEAKATLHVQTASIITE